jgi:hypothetical protein
VVLDDKELAKAPPFKAVGVLQLVGKETKQLTAFYDTAVAAGQAAGCDVLYQRDAFELGTRIPKARIPGSDGGIGRFIASSGREWHRSDELVWHRRGDKALSALHDAAHRPAQRRTGIRFNLLRPLVSSSLFPGFGRRVRVVHYDKRWLRRSFHEAEPS